MFSHITIPDWITIIGALVTAELAIANGTIKLTNAIPDKWVPAVQAWCGILAALGAGIITALSRFTGAAVVAAVALLLFFGDAHAQGGVKVRVPVARSAAQVDPLTKLMDDVSNVRTEIVTGAVGALNEADADAATLTNPSDPTSFRDPISHACYPAQVKFLQSLPQVQPIQAKMPYRLIVLFQRKRDLIAQIKAGLPTYLKVGCAALLGDEANTLIQTLGMVGISVSAASLTGIIPAAAPLTLPALTL